MTLTATLMAVEPSGTIVSNPSTQEMRSASSLHVLAFSSRGDLLVVESEGNFSMEIWDEVHKRAIRSCHAEEEDDGDQEDVSMRSEEDVKLEEMFRHTVHDKVVRERAWKQSSE